MFILHRYKIPLFYVFIKNSIHNFNDNAVKDDADLQKINKKPLDSTSLHIFKISCDPIQFIFCRQLEREKIFFSTRQKHYAKQSFYENVDSINCNTILYVRFG